MKPPLHRKYSEKKSLEFIRNRYRGMKGKFDSQIAALQADPKFLKQCEGLYAEGHKDWTILSAVFNRMLHLEAEARKIDPESLSGRSAYENLPYELKERVFPPVLFEGAEWDRAFDMHILPCLITYGFEPRTNVVNIESLKRFLRERMKHFDHDIPHDPMFGQPPAPWPKI